MQRSRFFAASFSFTLAGCAVTPEAPEEPAIVRNAVANAVADAGTVLGFEDPSLWRGPGSLASSTSHSQGAASLEVRPSGYAVYTSDPFTLSGGPRELVLDVALPAAQPNPYWYGAVQLYLESPSLGLYNAFAGQVELTGKPLGAFTPLSFALAGPLRERLARGVNDLTVKVALNVPLSGAPGPYLLDNLRIRTELLLHYDFEAREGERVLDRSGYDRHGTLRGAATLVPEGRDGAALSLDGATGYLEVPDGLLNGIREVTVAAWVNLSATPAWSRIFDFGGASGFVFLTPATHEPLLRYSAYAGFGVEGIVTAPPLPMGAWKHVAVTTSGRDYRLYVDGVEAANALTVPTEPKDIGQNSGNWLGRSRFPDPLLNGRIDEFRVYDRVLAPREIQALAAPHREYVSYRFDEPSGSVVKDSSDHRLDGAVTGAASRGPGVHGGALELAGGGGHVALPPGIVEACADFSFTGWVKLRSNAPWNRVFDFGRADLSSFMYLSPAGFGPRGQELRFGLIAPTGVHDVGYPFVMPLAEWHHLGVVVRGTTATLFVNGRAVTRANGVTANPSDMGRTLANYFGKSQFPDPTLDGSLDEVRLSCRAFTDAEVAQLAHLPAPADLPDQLALSGAIRDVHDPAIVEAAGNYYVFSTGPGLMARVSSDLESFTFVGRVFEQNPAWVVERFGNLDSLWAPDVSFFGGQYHLYYAASTFGSNRSCIGHATKADLGSPEAWSDHGPVLCSNEVPGTEDVNAIDPNVALDATGTPYLSFGSFWGGLKMARLTPAGDRADAVLLDVAARPSTAIEAPFITYRAPYYYLFASFDFCCRGTDSTYRTVVGRSTSITGPYLDRTGLDMKLGGGTPVVSGSSRYRGPGHNAVLRRGDQYLNVYHAYDALNGGVPTLRISELVWQEGWPVSAEP